MSALSSPHRNSLCLFTFADGRRCRTPRAVANRNFCRYHAQKEARAAAADLLATDLTYFFSGEYLSACDLSSALARIIPAVVQGHVKPRVARTVACLFQTFVQAVRLSQHEYINSFGTDGWRQAVRGSVDANSRYLSDAHSASESPQTNSQPSALGDTRQPQPSEGSQQAAATSSNISHPARGEEPQRAPSKPAPHHTSTGHSASLPPSTAHPDIDPARANAALTIARSLFPPHSANATSAPSRPADKGIPSSANAATSATPPAPPIPRGEARVAAGSPALPGPSAVEGNRVEGNPVKTSEAAGSPSGTPPSPSPSTQSPTSTPMPAPPRRFGPPGFEGNTDPYAIRLDASLVRIDGKPI